MEKNKRTMPAGFWGLPKSVMIGIAVVCIVLAGVIAYKYIFTTGGSGLEVFAGELQWVKCANKECGATYQMDKKKYFEQIEEEALARPGLLETPPLVCKRCGKKSIYEAVKCGNPQCGLVFFKGAAGPGDYSDRCPKCGYSQKERDRKEQRRGR